MCVALKEQQKGRVAVGSECGEKSKSWGQRFNLRG